MSEHHSKCVPATHLVARLGVAVCLSGIARGSLDRDHPLQMLHKRRKALCEADCVVLAGVPCDFWPDYGRHERRSATLIAANRSTKETHMNRRPDIAAIGDAGLFLETLAAQSPAADTASRWSPWMAQLCARDAVRETEIDEQAKPSVPMPTHSRFFACLSAKRATTQYWWPMAAISWRPRRT